MGRIDKGGRKWLITYERGRCDFPYFQWECHTDVPICLFAYLGSKPAWKKRGTHIKRGVVYHHDPELFCRYDDVICQNEHEETTIHTFTWRTPLDGSTFWWRCGGQTLAPFGRWSASRSPCFGRSCILPEINPFCQAEPHPLNWSLIANGWEGAWTFTPIVTHYITETTILMRAEPPYPPHDFHRLYLYTGYGPLWPHGDPLWLASANTSSLLGGDFQPVIFTYLPYKLYAGQPYVMSLLPLPFVGKPPVSVTHRLAGRNPNCPPYTPIASRWWRGETERSDWEWPGDIANFVNLGFLPAAP